MYDIFSLGQPKDGLFWDYGLGTGVTLYFTFLVSTTGYICQG